MPIMQSDARATKEPDLPSPTGPPCAVCGKPVQARGPGQRPSYCGRGCSSKAYRARVREREQALLGAALESGREPLGVPGADHLVRLGEIVERSARGLAVALAEEAGPMHARIGLSAVTRAVESLLSAARTAVLDAAE